jgi:thioredoxin 1
MTDAAPTVYLSDATFDAEVIQSELPVLVDFWATWCPPCRAVAPVLEDLARAYAGRAKIAKLDVDENPATAARFRIQAVPTMLFFQGGKVVDQAVGALPRAALAGKLDRLLPAGRA